MELKVSVLGTLEAGHRLSTDKENIQDSQKKGKTKLNLNFALGAVCSDFDIGSPLFTAEAKSFSGLLSSPIYVLCENGDILMVSPSPNTFSEALVRVVRILPSAEDCYTFDFDSVLVQRSTDAGNSPDVLCIANRSGRIFHGIVLHVPAAVLLESDSTSFGRSVPVLYLIDGVDLQLAKPLSGQKSRKDAPVISSSGSLSSDGPPQLSKISLLPSALNMLDANMAHYLCVHQFGIHCIILPWIERLGQLCSKASDDINFHSMDLASFPGDQGCTAEHLLLTHLDSKNADEAPLPGSLRSVIGVIPPQTLISDTSASRDDTFGGCQYVEETEVNSLLVLFSSRPHVVKIVLPQCLSLNPQPHSLPQLSLPSGDLPDVSLPETPLSTSVSLSCRVTESDFFRSCRRVLSNSSVRLPVLSTDLREDVFSEAEFIRFFVKTISSLRSSRLGRLSTLCASVYQFAEHAEGQLAAQYEAISYLAQERNQLQRKAVSLTERHSRILERQEALNHRLSELARRIYSVEAGLTNAEVQMRLEVQNLRDRLKSGLLGWFESMQLQYNHLTNVVEKAQATANSGRFGRLVAGVGLMGSAAPISLRRSTISADLTDAQVKSITAALKEEGSELDSLIKAVERLNTLTVALP
uniref:Nuclear pore complex protein Nup88 n=1 Tax=Schistocephalus solidus TaxID=70667 RepID=A0A0X3Q1X4_SCHSO